MKNWKTNLGGAISVTGTTLIGVGVLGNLNQTAISTVLWYVALFGFVLSAIGKGFTALFAADATTVQNVAAAVDKINQSGPDSTAAPSGSKIATVPPAAAVKP